MKLKIRSFSSLFLPSGIAKTTTDAISPETRVAQVGAGRVFSSLSKSGEIDSGYSRRHSTMVAFFASIKGMGPELGGLVSSAVESVRFVFL